MKSILNDDFLLSNDIAKSLYFDYAMEAPIIDYHCHIDPKEIADDKPYNNLYEMWLSGDHYKWRIMRSNGVAEHFITGNASDHEKFVKYAESMENAIGNPVFHWSHLELKRYFNYHGVLNRNTAEDVLKHCNKFIAEHQLSARRIIEASNVEIICTTDDPIDSLEHHSRIAQNNSFTFKVLPTWRPDNLLAIEGKDFLSYLTKLEDLYGSSIRNMEDLKDAIGKRMDFFHNKGCKVSDHGLSEIKYREVTEEQTDTIFRKALKGELLSCEEVVAYKTSMLTYLGKEYSTRNWVMQLHLGAQRNNNAKMYKLLGPDTGFDCIGSSLNVDSLAKFFNKLDETDNLPKTIVYSLDPCDNARIGALIGCFQGEGVKGKIQHGSAWWFNDHIQGMQSQIVSLANLGLLGNFVGMTTDSRSILSYVRHDYFRRILCDILGNWAEAGEIPSDINYLGEIVSNISSKNCRKYFDF